MFASLYHPHSLHFECMFLGVRRRKNHFGRKKFSFWLTALLAGLAGDSCGILVLHVLIMFSGCEFLDFSGFEKFSFQLVWDFFHLYSCVPAYVCVGTILYVGTSVRACVCTYASRDERLGSLNNMVF